jgi:hypothetical protein
MPILFALFLMLATVAQAQSPDGSQPAANMVKGDVLYWEGQELVVKEMSGREVRVRVTPETKIEGVAGRLKTGDKIAAQITSEGRASSITLQIPEAVTPPGVPGPR